MHILLPQQYIHISHDPWVVVLLLYDCQAGAIAWVDAPQPANTLRLVKEPGEEAVAKADEIINEAVCEGVL